MVGFRSPALLLLDYWTLAKFSHTVDGLYIWEFITTLDYELRVIRGRQPYRWSIWIYSLARFTMLMAVIIDLVFFNATTHIDCQALVTFNFIFAYTTFASSSLMMILRVIAIWNMNKVIMALASILWGVNVSLLIHGIIQLRSTWAPAQSSCSLPNAESNIVTIISMFITDFLLLVTMFIGLLRMRHRGGCTVALGRLLWTQGVIWLSLAAAAKLPPVVFICLDLNEAFNIMFMMPSLITMSIAATRMYRSLADFCSNDVVTGSDYPSEIRRRISNSEPTLIVPIPPRQMEFIAHTAHEKYPTSLTDRNVLYIGRDRPRQLWNSQDSLSVDDDVECGVQNDRMIN